MSRRRILAGLLLTLAAPFVAEAQQGRSRLVGVLHAHSGRTPFDDLLERRMSDLGWIDGTNVAYRYRYGRVNDALPALAKELVQERVDIIISSGTPASLAAKSATTTIPLVFYSVGDPVGVGLVQSLGHPGGNVTGISGVTYHLAAKRLELLKETLPAARLFGMLLNSTDPTVSRVLDTLKANVRSTSLAVAPFYAARPADLNPAFKAMKQRGVSGVLVQPDGMFWAERATIVNLAADTRLPTIYAFKQDVDAGGLMSYGASLPEMLERAIVYMDKILRGAKPAALPVQEPTQFECAINLKTAKALGLTVPPSLLLRADQVIE